MNTITSTIISALVSVGSLFGVNQATVPSVSPTPQIVINPTPTSIPRMEFKDEIKKWPYTVRYIIWIPKSEGTAEGEMKGYGWGVSEDCKVHFQGYYDGKEGGKISGDLNGQCTIPLFGGKITGILEGKVYPSKMGMQSWVKGKIGNLQFNEYLYTPRYY